MEREAEEVAKRIAESFGFGFVPTSYISKYDPDLRALKFDTARVLLKVGVASREMYLTLSRDEMLREFEAYAWHECMHGEVWERLGPCTPSRYVPEEYWINGKEIQKYGSPKFDGLTLLLYHSKEEPWWLTIGYVHVGGLDCNMAPYYARVLRFHSEEAARVYGYIRDLRGVCESVTSVEGLKTAKERVAKIFEENKVKVSEEVCD